ncbi:DUF3043 domain-containing protein [Tersicoccus solisilvae]|uniref:DUF3043 domain-containing protein n=1 Tax=Tersicoccus solisilvae TaxID=1882339 RepID=UPI001E2FC0CF|nr:DUF3043 domain-containing protein [Tersicoccus solisilvae]
MTAAPVEEPADATRRAGKGAPTPKRRDQEAARRRPLVPDDRKAAREANREATREARLRTRRAMDTGEDKYLPLRDKGPQKRFARDWVDARFSVGEVLLPLALVFVLLTFIPNTTIQSVVLVLFYAFFAIVVLDGLWLRRTLKRKLTAKFGATERGVYWYAFMRTLQFRRIRLPKPMVKRGQYPS